MKKEHFATYGTPNCKSSNPCSNYKYGSTEHSSCKNDKWRVCAVMDGSNFCNARQIQAEKSTEPMKVCDTNERGWKLYPDPLQPN